MSQEITPLQTLVLWWLLVKGGSGLQKDIKPEIAKKDREALVAAGLITADTKKRPYVLHVTDKGWHWANRTAIDCTISRSQIAADVLRSLLAHLGAYMQARQISLAEILTTAPRDGSRNAIAGEVAPVAPPHDATPPDPDALRARIRDAFLKLTGGRFNARVRLADLRPLLAEFDRATQDAAILAMARETDADLMQLDNRIDITDADRAAALRLGAEPRHLLWISK